MARLRSAALVMAILAAGCLGTNGAQDEYREPSAPTTPAEPPFPFDIVSIDHYAVTDMGCSLPKASGFRFEKLEFTLRNNQNALGTRTVDGKELRFIGEAGSGNAVVSCADTFATLSPSATAKVSATFRVPYFESQDCVETAYLVQKLDLALSTGTRDDVVKSKAVSYKRQAPLLELERASGSRNVVVTEVGCALWSDVIITMDPTTDCWLLFGPGNQGVLFHGDRLHAGRVEVGDSFSVTASSDFCRFALNWRPASMEASSSIGYWEIEQGQTASLTLMDEGNLTYEVTHKNRLRWDEVQIETTGTCAAPQQGAVAIGDVIDCSTSSRPFRLALIWNGQEQWSTET